MEETNRTSKAANGTEIPILGEINLPIEIGSYSTQVVGLVSKHVPQLMLDIDFKTRNKVIRDFDKGNMDCKQVLSPSSSIWQIFMVQARCSSGGHYYSLKIWSYSFNQDAVQQKFPVVFKMEIGALDWIVQCLRPRQHGIGYMGDGFYRSKDPTNSIKVLKEMLQKQSKQRKQLNTHMHR